MQWKCWKLFEGEEKKDTDIVKGQETTERSGETFGSSMGSYSRSQPTPVAAHGWSLHPLSAQQSFAV